MTKKDILHIRDNSFAYGVPESSGLRHAVFNSNVGTEFTEPYLRTKSELFLKMTEFIENCHNWNESSVHFHRHEILKLMKELKLMDK